MVRGMGCMRRNVGIAAPWGTPYHDMTSDGYATTWASAGDGQRCQTAATKTDHTQRLSPTTRPQQHFDRRHRRCAHRVSSQRAARRAVAPRCSRQRRPAFLHQLLSCTSCFPAPAAFLRLYHSCCHQPVHRHYSNTTTPDLSPLVSRARFARRTSPPSPAAGAWARSSRIASRG
jgi:hypothetical protein